MKKILVTGSSGLVGNAIKTLEQKYPGYAFIHLSSKVCDLTKYEQVYGYFDLVKPDTIIHLAACVGGLFKNMNEKVKMFEENILINTHVVKAAHECGVQELIACLSTCVFPENDVLNESMLHEGPPHHSNEGYAYAKRMMEVHCRLYRTNFPNRRYFCIIPTNIYGPHDNFNLEDSHVIPGLIHKCYLAKQQGIPFEVKGSGKPLRQFIYSTDLAKLIFYLLESDFNENIILCDSKEYSIHSVAQMINSHFGNVLTLNQSYSDGQYRKNADNSKLTNLINNFEFTDLKDGIKETIDWFNNNYDNLRK